VIRRVLAAIVLCCTTVVPTTGQQPTFSSRRDSVRVDVMVRDSGRPVAGLQSADFEILDSGVLQQIDFLVVEQLPVTIGLALDGSASISADQLQHLREGSRAVLDMLKPDDQAALLTFANLVELRERLTSDVNRVSLALDRIEPSTSPFGGTSLIDACYTAMTMLAHDGGRGLLIVFTDGIDTASWLPAERVLAAARRANLVVYSVSTGKLPKGAFLRELSDVTGGDAIEITSTDNIRAAFVRIVEEFRQRYVLSYSPAKVPSTGWHPITVRVKGRNVNVNARAGYVRR
jgi:VWFA-related protein